MNKLKSIITDFRGIKWYESLFLIVVGLFLTLVSFIDLNTFEYVWENKPTWKGVLGVTAGLAAFTGILCVFMIGKGKLSNYFWGTINALTYGVYAFSVAYTGDAILNLLYYLPTQIVGFIMWSKHMGKTKVKVNKFTFKDLILYTVITAILFGAFWIIIPAVDVELNKNVLHTGNTDYWYRDKMLPRVLDTLTNSVSIVAQLFMLKRFKEQWYLWIGINVMQIAMYAGLNGEAPNIPMIVMWSVFLINAVYATRSWTKKGDNNE